MSGEPLPISVCMIVRDEAERLPATLAALGGAGRPFAEVVVLDTGSADGSVEICRNAGCRVETSDWPGFTEARRRVFGLTRTPWLFWLDADEVLTPALRDEIDRTFGRGDTALAGIDGFRVNRISKVDGRWIRHGDWFPDWNLRIVRADRWSMDDRLVHESVRVPGRVERLEGLLEHHTFKGWDDLRARSDRYARLWAQQERVRGRRTAPGLPTLRAVARFLRGTIVKGGILDGPVGIRLALAIAREVRMKHALLRHPLDEPGASEPDR